MCVSTETSAVVASDVAVVETKTDDGASSLLQSMPLPPAAGLALGFAGLAGIVRKTVALEPVALCALAGAVGLVAAITARAAARGSGALREELSTPRVAFAYGAVEMALVLAVGPLLGAAAAPFFYTCAALQAGLLAAFLAACAKTGAGAEPYWAPPCVGSGATCVAGAAALGPRHWLVVSSWILACVGAVVLAPAATVRVARRDDVAADATVFILQAPFSMPGLAFSAMRRAAGRGGAVFSGRLDAALGDALFAASTLGLVAATVAAWRRRREIFGRGFEPKWAALTFPLCLSALCALQYAGGRLALRAYAFALAAAAAALVVGVAAGDARCVALRLRRTRPDTAAAKGGGGPPL